MPPCFVTPTKAIGNDGASHAGPDAEETEAKPDAYVEKQFNESSQSTGKKRKHNPYLQYTEVKLWKTGPDSLLEPAQINHEMYTHIKKFMQQSRFMKLAFS